MFMCPEWVILQKSSLNWLYPLFHVTELHMIQIVLPSDCATLEKWQCSSYVIMFCSSICAICLSIVTNIVIYHHAMVSVSVLSISWRFFFISDFCVPYHTADVENMDQEVFVSVFLISVLNTLVQVSVSVFWVILSKPNSEINTQFSTAEMTNFRWLNESCQ